jgi:hypothetical protein
MEESRITCAKFINADITLVIFARERGAVSPNFPHCSHPYRNPRTRRFHARVTRRDAYGVTSVTNVRRS